MKRYLHDIVTKELKEKMVFLGGPRQVGKTTLSLQILEGDSSHPAYLCWDFPKDRRHLKEGILPGGEKLLVLDEIHKYAGWRNLVKGLYDKHRGRLQFLITGSASLDYYRRGGDSLIGRYFFYRLHPLSLYEIDKHPTDAHFERLWAFGGFPEMYVRADKQHLKKWQKTRVSRIIQDDLLSLEQIREISQMELLTLLLKERVASLLSLNGLRRELSCSHESVSRWISILENIYYCFRIYPYGVSGVKSLKKEAKIYLWDWTELEDEGKRFENIVASHLLKYCHYHEDAHGDRMELRFLRDREKREIDFVVLKDGRPLFAVECKLGPRGPSKCIKYYAKRTDIPLFYQVHRRGEWQSHAPSRCEMISFPQFCSHKLKV